MTYRSVGNEANLRSARAVHPRLIVTFLGSHAFIQHQVVFYLLDAVEYGH